MQNPIQIGSIAPDFDANTTMGELNFHKWIGNSWCILFSHPKDFTPVCTTELGMAAKLMPEFSARNVKLIAISVGNVSMHRDWIPDINSTQSTSINFPIIGDEDKRISNQYGMIHSPASDTATVRTVFIIDPKKIIRLMLCYPASTGRNFDEILRVVDSLQITDNYKVATPANWKKGDDCVILPSVTDEQELKKLFPKGIKQLKPYLRLTPDPTIRI